jgi:hypothetical protein
MTRQSLIAQTVRLLLLLLILNLVLSIWLAFRGREVVYAVMNRGEISKLMEVEDKAVSELFVPKELPAAPK